MLVQEVAKKYARALFLSSSEKSETDSAYEQLGSLALALLEDNSLLTFLSSPRIDEKQKQAAIRSMFTERTNKLVVEFLILLVVKHRANYLPEIIDEFNRLVEFEKGIVRVTVITALPLTSDEESHMTARLTAISKGKVELEKKVDPSIWGGSIVIMHDQIIDGSVHHGMNKIQEQLEKIKVH